MIIDSSVLIAICYQEEEADLFVSVLLNSGGAKIAAPNYVETIMILQNRFGPQVLPAVRALMDQLAITIVPVTELEAHIAAKAALEYGKIKNHPSILNLGDCFSYALSKSLMEPLLFKGDHFKKTDVIPAI